MSTGSIAMIRPYDKLGITPEGPLMIALFTDFGIYGPYSGQMKAVLLGRAPDVAIVDLLCDAPAFNPRTSSYLLAAYSMVDAFPPGTVFLCVVDPGVGSDRAGLMINADGRWYVGPDNGLFEMVMRRSGNVTVWQIGLSSVGASATFHGRDIFAPVAAGLARGQGAKDAGAGRLVRNDDLARFPWPDNLSEIIYTDSFGNLVTGIRGKEVNSDADRPREEACIHIENMENRIISKAQTFSDVSSGTAFWYQNSSGLIEIAVSGGNAKETLGLGIGMRVWLSAD